ncbi:hypothetical protein TSOC_000265 [Tetrabaena socialis]|uniref:Uncharacterized protein n=1 Tax=Tetrabaena socialis TaxID=47790 RepID=A0A2J8AJR1_9CHLO|nr:hypothetical protein TSOC_000265 [Tetrabaena socialis]|eukprot:PNH12749.1 hypothetical protein TSOC_000265 [Tetrabaena socialis]
MVTGADVDAHRRLRKSVYHPPGPSATLFPSKGHAAAKPSDGKEWAFTAGKHIVPGRSYSSTMSTLLRQDVKVQQAMPTRTAAYPDQLAGGSVAVISETAPSCVLRSKAQLRTGFSIGRSAHADVLQYRFSEGICSKEYQLNTDRPAAPQLATTTPAQSRVAFFDSRSSYNANKTRALASNVLTQ